jgi:hypothetical protein
MKSTIPVFCCYARKDYKMLNELKKHLTPLVREELIQIQSDVDIQAGKEWEKEIEKYLDTAQIILLLLSPNFMASPYCNDIEMKRAIKRHDRGEARVIPLLLDSVDLYNTSLGKLQALPANAKPVIKWRPHSGAFLAIANGIPEVVEEFRQKSQGTISISHKLLVVLNKHKERCQTLNIPFDTPHLLLALFDIDDSRTLYHLNNLNPSHATKLRRRYEYYTEKAQRIPKRPFLDFQWEERKDMQVAHQLALQDGSNEVTEEHLLLGVLDTRNTSITVRDLRKLLGEDDFHSLVRSVQGPLEPVVPIIGTLDDFGVDTVDFSDTLENVPYWKGIDS